ncbi:MAG: aromatic amino acid transport family protein [Candidatus Nanoarchaeia archaeon]|jgi:tyrosine-specific transport protein
MKVLFAIATIIGTVIGAGVLGLPYAISVSGFIPGVILTLLIGFAMTMLLLYLGEVVLRCKEVYQLPGLVRKYLSKNSYRLTMVLFVLSIYGALISYTIGVSSSLVGNQTFYMFLFIGLMSIPILKGVHLMDKVQLIMISGLIIMIVIIGLSITPLISLDNLLMINPTQFFYPFGVIFFALTGYSVMPELEQILLKEKKSFLPAVLIAMIACTIIYLLFSAVFIGAFNGSIQQVATQSLSGSLGLLGTAIAVFGMTTSFMGLGVALSDMFKHDLGFSKVKSWGLTCLVPLLIAVLFKPDFIQPIQISGSYAGTITGFIIIALWFKARKVRGVKPYFKAPFGLAGAVIVSVILAMGLVMTTFSLFNLA